MIVFNIYENYTVLYARPIYTNMLNLMWNILYYRVGMRANWITEIPYTEKNKKQIKT